MVRGAANRIGSTVTAYDGETVDLSGRLTGTIALTDLRAACALAARPLWDAMVLEAFHGLALSAEAVVDLSDLAQVGPLLRSRVYAEGAVLVDDVVTQHLADGLVEVLVAQLGGAVRAVPPAAVQIWGGAPPFARARQQTLDAGLAARSTLDLDGVELVALELPTPFAATHVHWLPSYVDVPPAGALVCLPTRHLVLAAPMTRRQQVLDAAQVMLVNAEQLWRDGPGGLSPDLYWWHPPSLVLLPGTPSSLTPPAAFLEVLDALPA